MADASGYAIHVGSQGKPLCGQVHAHIITPLVLGRPEGCLRCLRSWLKMVRGPRKRKRQEVGR
jgi:hypothetical protein